jgi:hypothetical protein
MLVLTFCLTSKNVKKNKTKKKIENESMCRVNVRRNHIFAKTKKNSDKTIFLFQIFKYQTWKVQKKWQTQIPNEHDTMSIPNEHALTHVR